MKKIFPNKLSIILTVALFLTILSNSILCFLVDPFKANYSNKIFILLIFVVLVAALNIFLNFIFIKKCSNKTNLLIINVSLMLISALICTVTFKIASIVNPNTIFNKTGFTSVIILFSYYALSLIMSIVPFLMKAKEKSFSEKQI